MAELKLGTITDLEGNLAKLNKILKKFKKEKIEVLVLAGDIPSDRKNSLSRILKRCLLLRIPIFLIPGSHESFDMYEMPLRKIKNKLIVDGVKTPKVKIGGYDFIFVPGSDVLSKGAQYVLLNDKREKEKHRKWRKENLEFYKSEKFKPGYINKISRLIRNPKKTILISHIPPYFRSKKSIDIAISGKATRVFSIKNEHRKNKIIKEKMGLLKEIGKSKDMVKKGIIIYKVAKKLKKYNYPVKIHKKNVGNKPLKRVIKQKKITKLICGHIHESGGKACNLSGKLIPKNKFSNELFLNSGPAEKGYAGIVILKDDKAKYNIIKT